MKLPGANRLAAALKATAIVIMLVLSGAANAAYLTNMPHIITQPDKSIVNCLVSGDEFYNWIHDADGYVIVQDHSDGWFVYATLAGGDVVGTQYVVGSVKPADVGLTPNIKPSVQKLQTLKAALFTLPMGMDLQPAPQSGAINNIAIYIRFSDDTEFTDAASSYNTIFNSTTSGTSSMRNYFWETSYNVLTINTTFYPTPGGATVVSYQDTNPRAYYLPYDATTNPIGYTEANNASREHTLLANAVNAVKSQIPTGLNVDADNDGEVDNVCFIVKGATSNWGTLLWPHAWFLYSQTVTINSKRVWGYNLQFGSWMMPSGVGVLAHEMMHSLGAPDLYHYTPGTAYDPVGAWDVMCGSGNPPQHTCAYMKYKYMNWISTLPVISTPGAYTLNPLTSGTGNCYKIAAAGTTSEFYVLEYRKRTAPFENSVPGSGLLVYRINTAVYGNSDGPPDEIYVYRPNGTNTVNGTLNSAHYSSSVGRTAINNGTNPAGFLTNGSLGGLNISNIGAAGATISFTVSFKLPNPTISPAGGTFTGSQTVTLALPGGIGNIYYTTDGTTPDTSDPYVNSGGTIVLNSSTTLNAKAFYTGYTASDMVSAAFVALPTYTITASAGANGTISPSGTVSVTHGTNKTFTFTANTGYVADQVTIDGGAPVAAGASYTFTNVQAAHTISITFKPAPTFTITASSDANGTISPTGAVIVTQGNNQTFTIAANSGYRVSRVLVDGVNVGAVTTYTFSNVIVAHTISAEFISTDFAAYWKFDETSGASAYDWSGNGKNGTLTNGPTWTAGLINNAVNIPGGTSYVSVPSGIVLGLINFSISTWVKLTTVATNMRIFDFGTSATNYMELTPKHSDTNGALQYVIRTPGTINTVSGTTALPTGSWQHVAITRSGITNTLYRNGVQVGQITGTLSPNSLTSTTINRIGDSQTSTHPHLDGLLDDFRIYNKALTAAEIANLYNAGAPTWTITASAGAGGTISPLGTTTKNNGASQTYAITANSGYAIADVLIDGVSQGAVGTYTFSNITANHTISATFVKPLGVNNKAVKNDSKLQGKVVKVWGKVKSIGSGTFQISDGYSANVTIAGPTTGLNETKTVVVTGTVNADKSVTAQTIGM